MRIMLAEHYFDEVELLEKEVINGLELKEYLSKNKNIYDENDPKRSAIEMYKTVNDDRYYRIAYYIKANKLCLSAFRCGEDELEEEMTK